MRVITGTARGKRLATLTGDAVRPTPERIKEAVFSVVQFDIEGRRMLDLFTGSGQMAIEALSRGAAQAVMVDISRDSLRVAEENLHSTGLRKGASHPCGGGGLYRFFTGTVRHSIFGSSIPQGDFAEGSAPCRRAYESGREHFL